MLRCLWSSGAMKTWQVLLRDLDGGDPTWAWFVCDTAATAELYADTVYNWNGTRYAVGPAEPKDAAARRDMAP